MGLFEFFKRKKSLPPNTLQDNFNSSGCDENMTQIIIKLLAIPREKRDEIWFQSFFENLQYASFKSGKPKVYTGPDGFTYFALFVPQLNKSYEPFCIGNMTKNFLLQNGWGVAINPQADQADWIFSYGDIVNYHLHHEFFTNSNLPEIKNEWVVLKEEKVLLTQPSEFILPNETRICIKLFLQNKGFSKPKILMITQINNEVPVPQLAFNIFREDLNTPEELNLLFTQISWFLPKHYVMVLVPKESEFNAHFIEL